MQGPHKIAAIFVSLALAGCSGAEYANLPRGAAAYKIAPPIDQAPVEATYAIAPGDELAIAVFDEPDLSVDKIPVDTSGRVQVPLVGSVKVADMTPDQASKVIEAALGAKFLRDPKVTVNVTTMGERLVSVEGQVTKAGAYPVAPDTTLLSAISMAQSPTRIAKLDDTVIFRTVNGQRMAARFDLKRIRAGLEPDPKIVGGDVVVVGFSSSKSVYRDVLTAAPIFNVFTRF